MQNTLIDIAYAKMPKISRKYSIILESSILPTSRNKYYNFAQDGPKAAEDGGVFSYSGDFQSSS